jgi:glucose-6-phosphate 1-dehydrogenase
MSTGTVVQAEPAEQHEPPPRVRVTEPFALVIFGATGDLAARKLLPALFSLWHDHFFEAPFAIVGVGRRDQDDAKFRQELQGSAEEHRRAHPDANGTWDDFAKHLFYQRGDFTKPDSFPALAKRLQALEKEQGLAGNRLFYLATDPEYFGPIVEQLAATRLVNRDVPTPWTRVIIEKPFGHDLDSARELNQQLTKSLREEQIYRIDHYLGKETVQNILAFRFGNAIFEPLFGRQYVDHVQITAAETVGMEGHRGAYYDHAGAFRDVAENHLMQLLALVAMEPPAALTAKDLHDEKLKVFRSLEPMSESDVDRWVVRGQYGPGRIDGKPVPGYREEQGVDPKSSTESYVALRVKVDNWRWAGVPFFLRTGKRMKRRVTEIAVQFKQPPLRLFETTELQDDVCYIRTQPSVLAFRIQPNEGISLSFCTKRPGMSMELSNVRMDFQYGQAFHQLLPEAYQRLLLDALRGDATLFMRSDELDLAWEFAEPILETWQKRPPPPFPNYAAGTWGPAEAKRLPEAYGACWREP